MVGAALPGMLCESCFETLIPGEQDTLIKLTNQKMKNDTCDVIVQIKAFTKEKYHIMMQVNISASESALDELDTTTGISIIHVEKQVKCSSNGIDGKLLSTKTIIFCSAILAAPDVNQNDKKPIDVAPAILSCPAPQQIFVDHPREELVMNSAVRCKNVKWLYKKNGTDVAVDVGQAISVYCAIKFSELCTHSAPFLIKDCRGCSPPTPIGNYTFKCDGNKWRMSDGSVEVTEVKCKRKGNERTSAWQTDNGIAITEGACSQDFDCATSNNFNFPVPKKDEVYVYKAVDKIGDGNRLNCSEGFNLTYISSDGATKIIDEDLICDTGSGFFYPEGHSKEKEKQANHTSSVYCAKKHGEVIKKDNPENAQPATGAMRTKIAAGIGGTIVVLLIIGGVVIFLLLKRSKGIQDEMAREEKLANCPDIKSSKADGIKNPDP
ncbi:hypothetical protein PRIPAC_74195 [Pristionchus pacificus]|uniref:Uncharacterized protein n=1 Tax=Pristionchus pacificus TaxID=54126 RepID=A0A2A6BR87_PRIPA|nr:hypothetical protein PRIPAC_74195 [Pristionchus pacificus]|eukprot:PDM68439.1 hypothetical protein PRIPAC_43941 [Pristionchus pacificus]